MKDRRDKYPTRKILLRAEAQREIAIRVLQNAPLDDARPLEFLLREEVKARKLDQNNYYWLRIGEIAEHGWLNGRQYSSEVWHEYAKRHLMPEQVTTKNGEVRSKWIESPDGTLTVISTTQLEKGFFAKYTTQVEAFGAGIGVEFSADPRMSRAA